MRRLQSFPIPWSTGSSGTAGRGRGRIRRLLIIVAISLLIPLLSFAAFRAAVAWLPYPSAADQPIVPSTWIVDRDGNSLAAFASLNGQWCMPLASDQISQHLLDAVIATEDCRFYEHAGVDWEAVVAAAAHDLAVRSGRRGASTITMQLFRLRQPAARSLAAKLLQAIHASQLDRELSKQQILTEYLNRAPFGGNLVGAGAASWRYFGRPCRNLSLGQATLLAGIPQNPNALRPDRFPARAKIRRDHVLERMLACGMITPAERTLAANEPIDATWRPLPQFAPDASPGLLPMLADLANRNPGQTIATAIDSNTQKVAENLAEKTLEALAPSHIDSAAVVVLDTAIGNCRADVSLTAYGPRSPPLSHSSHLRTFLLSHLLDLTARPRSTGSTLKPFIYAAAFDAGICTPGTSLDDSPTAWSGYQPADYDHNFAGPLSAAEALAQSRNIPALLLLSKVTVPKAVEIMNALGLHTLAHQSKPYGLPLAIGGADATPMELAQAYAALARTALNLTPSPGIPGEGRGGGLRPWACLSALYSIADPDRTARICPSAAHLAPAWKTGTSSGHRDAWCAAVTPTRTVVVWLGNLDGSGSDRLVGADAAVPLALHILAAIAPPSDRSFLPPPAFAANPSDPSAELSPRADQLILLSPTPNQEILADPTIPPDRQQLSLRARTTGGSATSIYWFIDGKSIGRSDDGQPLLWPPTPGLHEIRAVDETGQAAMAEVHVH
jgi:penicillin-binding protein 1C